MSLANAIAISIAGCVAAAVLEGVCAGRNVKSFFSNLRMPRYAAPLWLWSIIGGIYYVIFCVVGFRLLRLTNSPFQTAALLLIIFMMLLNAASNYFIFRAQNLYLSFLIGCFFPVFDVALFICLLQLDRLAALCLVPYLIYRVYGVWWGYEVWKMNPRLRGGTVA
jgi:tryptophan-rich sensory protein